MFIPKIRIDGNKLYYSTKPKESPDYYWIKPLIGNIIRYKQDGRTVYLQGEDGYAIILRLGSHTMFHSSHIPAQHKEAFETFLKGVKQ